MHTLPHPCAPVELDNRSVHIGGDKKSFNNKADLDEFCNNYIYTIHELLKPKKMASALSDAEALTSAGGGGMAAGDLPEGVILGEKPPSTGNVKVRKIRLGALGGFVSRASKRVRLLPHPLPYSLPCHFSNHCVDG